MPGNSLKIRKLCFLETSSLSAIFITHLVHEPRGVPSSTMKQCLSVSLLTYNGYCCALAVIVVCALYTIVNSRQGHFGGSMQGQG